LLEELKSETSHGTEKQITKEYMNELYEEAMKKEEEIYKS